MVESDKTIKKRWLNQKKKSKLKKSFSYKIKHTNMIKWKPTHYVKFYQYGEKFSFFICETYKGYDIGYSPRHNSYCLPDICFRNFKSLKSARSAITQFRKKNFIH